MANNNRRIAFILAGGKGTRLRPYTYTIPKPLLPIGDKPILELIINQLKLSNIEEIIISIGYKSNYIKAFFGDGTNFGVQIRYVEELSPLGTCGPIGLAKQFIKEDDHVILMNGDIYTELDFSKFILHAQKMNYPLMVGYIERNEVGKFGVLNIEGGLVRSVIEKPSTEILASAGIYAIRGDILNMIPMGTYFTVPDLINLLIQNNFDVGSYRISDYWMGIEYAEDLSSVVERVIGINK